MTSFRLGFLAAPIALLAASQGQAALTIYSGFDSGSSAPGVNATAAAASFDAAVLGSTIETFESFAPGADTNGLAGAGYTLSSTGFNIQAGTTCGATLCGDNTTPGGRLFAYSNAASASLTFNFAQPVTAFGAYFGGLQTGTNAVVFTSGGQQRISINPDAPGGFAFVGFSDPNASILAVTIDVPFDLISVDDVRYLSGAIPEPATWAMMLLGFGFAGTAVRARKTGTALRTA